MPLIVFTAKLSDTVLDNPDALVISRKFNEKRWADGGHRGIAVHFCPSKGLQAARYKRCRFLLENETPDEWELYERQYTEEMRRSYREHRLAWEMLLGWERVVLVRDDDAPRSARVVLAAILVKLGASYGGEL